MMAPVSLTAKVLRLSLAALLIFACLNSSSLAQTVEAVVTVGDTIAFPNTTNTVISVFVDNYPVADTIVGFKLQILIDPPLNMMAFQVDSGISVDTTYWRCVTYDLDSNCIDSLSVPVDSLWNFFNVDTFEVEIGNFDTTGTLIAGWEYVAAQSTAGGGGTDLVLVGIANLAGGGVTRGFAPQQGGLLIKLLADILDVSDTIEDRNVILHIETDFKPNLNLVSVNTDWSIWDYETFWDTNGWVCTQWVIDTTVEPPETLSCLNYERQSTPPWDSIEVRLDSTAFLDTTRIKIYDGTLIIEQGFHCGDINNDGTFANILDLNFLVNYIFRGGVAPNPLCSGDLNCDNSCSNILDLNTLINFIFRGGPNVCLEC
jgi:hypothetical protein